MQDQVMKIIYSGLYATVKQIYCFLAGSNDNIEKIERYIHTLPAKFNIQKKGVDDKTYERFTLNSIESLVTDADKFLYIHTKGVTRTFQKGHVEECVTLWRNYMEYYLIALYKKCLAGLADHDVAGVLYKDVTIGPHFSGNFWWSTGKYFRQLFNTIKIGEMYYDSEAYIMKGRPKVFDVDGRVIANEFCQYTNKLFPRLYVDKDPVKGGETVQTKKQHGGTRTVDLVIARYKEPLTWLGEYKDRGFKAIHIYNKSDMQIACPTFAKESQTKCHVHNIKNVGVCDHTYLYHIVHNYDKLADVTIFAPGSSDMKFKSIILDFTIGRAFETKNTVMNIFRFDIGVGEAMYNFTMDLYSSAYDNNKDGVYGWVKQAPAEIRPFGAWYAHNFPGEQPKEASFFGIMAMAKEHILRRPKSFYENLMRQVQTDKSHEASHYIERSYPAMLHPLPAECYYQTPVFDMKIGSDQAAYKKMQR
jgi:hypothetical protein